MSMFHILRDNREQKPYDFERYPSVTTSDVTLTTGDYTLEPLCEYDEANDTYRPQLAVERKAGQDLLNSLTHDRDRFEAEIKRAADWREKLEVVVEEPWETFAQQRDFMQYRDVHPNQISGTIEAWEKYHNVRFSFHPDRRVAERVTFDTLLDWWRDLQPS